MNPPDSSARKRMTLDFSEEEAVQFPIDVSACADEDVFAS